MGTAAAVNQSDNQNLMLSIAQTAAVQPVFPTAVPTDIPTPTMIPTLAPVVEEEAVIQRDLPVPTDVPTLSAADARLEGMMSRNVTLNLNAATELYSSPSLSTRLGQVYSYNHPISGRIVSYDERTVNMEVTFNIGRSQISMGNNVDVNTQTYIRLYSNVASETQPIFITSGPVTLAAPATDCTDSAQSFCHGTFSIWLDRAVVEGNLQ